MADPETDTTECGLKEDAADEDYSTDVSSGLETDTDEDEDEDEYDDDDEEHQKQGEDLGTQAASPGASSVSNGRYMLIRPRYRSTREIWCFPGAVLGLYTDGVGPLLPVKASRERQSIVVCASEESLRTIEHPDKKNDPDHVLVATCGDVLVRLRIDQYDKISRWRLRSHWAGRLYVNRHGDVCLRMLNKPSPPGGVEFAQLWWTTTPLTTDEEDYPIYQGVRGVCVYLTGSLPLEVTSPFQELFRKMSSFLRARSNSDTLDGIMASRLSLYGDLTAMKRRHFTCTVNREENNPLHAQHDPKNCRLCFLMRANVSERKPLKSQIKDLNKRLQSLTG